MLSNRIWSLGRSSPISQLINAFRTVSIQAVQRLSTRSNVRPVSIRTVDKNLTKANHEIFEKVNSQIAAGHEGRLFAVVQLCGKQFKITSGDIILVEGYWPPNIGDSIRLDKVLVAGGNDFSLIGRPLLQSGLVDVQATIIEKTLTHTKTHFKKKRRKQYVRFNFHREQNTMIMINSISFTGRVNERIVNDNPIRIF